MSDFQEIFLLINLFLLQFLEEIATSGLEGNEYVTVLSWVMNTYPGIELMNHVDLKVDVLSMVEPLIKPELLKDLEDKYLKVR